MSHSSSDPLASIGGSLPLPLPVPDWSKPIILLLLILVIALGVRWRLATRRAGRLERRQGSLLRDIEVMQAALVPEVPARLEGLAVSVAYRPAEGPAAGGDFYDVFAMAPHRVAVILGDVAGHGHDALRQAALTRYTLRAFLKETGDPRAALALAGHALSEPGGRAARDGRDRAVRQRSRHAHLRARGAPTADPARRRGRRGAGQLLLAPGRLRDADGAAPAHDRPAGGCPCVLLQRRPDRGTPYGRRAAATRTCSGASDSPRSSSNLPAERGRRRAAGRDQERGGIDPRRHGRLHPHLGGARGAARDRHRGTRSRRSRDRRRAPRGVLASGGAPGCEAARVLAASRAQLDAYETAVLAVDRGGPGDRGRREGRRRADRRRDPPQGHAGLAAAASDLSGPPGRHRRATPPLKRSRRGAMDLGAPPDLHAHEHENTLGYRTDRNRRV